MTWGGFSKFFSQPDVHHYVPKFLNKINDCINIIINGKETWWATDIKKSSKALPKPVHIKFLGDGALYIWTDKSALSKANVMMLSNRLWNLQNDYGEVLKRCTEEVPIVDIPDKIRFGLAAGTVYKLTYKNSSYTEYIGYPINLASRLQNYCSELNFIASARVNLPERRLSKSGYIKVIAKKLKGFPKEFVIVDEAEYEDLDATTRRTLFDKVPR